MTNANELADDEVGVCPFDRKPGRTMKVVPRQHSAVDSFVMPVLPPQRDLALTPTQEYGIRPKGTGELSAPCGDRNTS